MDDQSSSVILDSLLDIWTKIVVAAESPYPGRGTRSLQDYGFHLDPEFRILSNSHASPSCFARRMFHRFIPHSEVGHVARLVMSDAIEEFLFPFVACVSYLAHNVRFNHQSPLCSPEAEIYPAKRQPIFYVPFDAIAMERSVRATYRM
jgi:hypothetical protein